MNWRELLLDRRETRVRRWHTRGGGESLAEHHALAARAAYWLAPLVGADPARAALLALFHDAPEVLTGDLPFDAQRLGPAVGRLKDELDELGSAALVAEYPRGARVALAGLLGEVLAGATVEARVAKWADMLVALAYVEERAGAGDAEMDGVAERQLDALAGYEDEQGWLGSAPWEEE